MTAPSRTNTKNGSQRGFALLTVIFFVLALTILGLSLFSLSNFEAGFYRPAVSRAEVVQAARGAAEWARWVMERTNDLQQVRNAAKPSMVTGALARRGLEFDSADSIGGIFQAPYDPVWVRVVVADAGQQQVVLAKFQPIEGADLYRRLITAMDYLFVNVNEYPVGHPSGTVGRNRIDQLRLYGRVATPRIREENNQDLAPAAIGGNWCLQGIPNGLPRPEEDLGASSAWWQTHAAAATIENGNVSLLNLSSGGAPYKVFLADEHEHGSDRWWSVFSEDLYEIKVTGTCLWMLPEGLRTVKQVRFTPGDADSATLILVARPGESDTPGIPEHDVGFAFLGGIMVDPRVRLFLVSSGGVELEQVEDAAQADAFARYLSVYADWVRIQAPVTNSNNAFAEYSHGNACGSVPPEDQFGRLVDQLIEQNLLPNSRFSRRRLMLASAGWQEAAVGAGN